jgi:hypothetical protein
MLRTHPKSSRFLAEKAKACGGALTGWKHSEQSDTKASMRALGRLETEVACRRSAAYAGAGQPTPRSWFSVVHGSALPGSKLAASRERERGLQS